ncbi:MAG: mechanosensitive ion channel family protein [Planctomycetota bacterium]|nr:mechanosensitive ion channel family protein [Planctomycetota bacterium]MDA1137688.1 mechanosensitive ion channel family protein [Planctomycetota bacterium]
MNRLKSIIAVITVLPIFIYGELSQKLEPSVLRTPRMTAQTFHNYASGNAKRNFYLAAQCFDLSQLVAPSEEDRLRLGAQLAEVLISALDAKGYPINLYGLPDLPEVPEGELTFVSNAPQFRLMKVGETWLLSAYSVAQIRPFYDSVISSQARWILEHMPASLRKSVLGVAYWQMIGLFFVLLLTFIARRLTIYLCGNQLLKLAGKTRLQWDDDLVEAAARPIGLMVFAGLLGSLFPNLQFGMRVSQMARVTCVALFAYSAIWLFYRLVDVVAVYLAQLTERTDTKLDDQLIPILRKTLKTFVVLIGVIFTLQNLDVDVTSFIAGLGIGGLAFALAAKDTLSNLFGSIMILVDRPFQIGDWVVIGEQEGTVEEVGLRSTRIRTFYKSQITIPNANLATTNIDNMGRRDYRRIKTYISIQYDTPPDRIEAFIEGIRQIILANEFSWKDYFHVYLNQFNASSLDILFYAFVETNDWGIELRERGRIFLEIIRLAEKLNVDFAFPTQTVHIDSFPGHERPATREEALAEMATVAAEFGPGGGFARPESIDMKKLAGDRKK